MKQKWLVLCCAILWFSALVSGWCVVERYERTPGAQSRAPEWLTGRMLPAGTLAATPKGVPVLLVALHPQCTCSLATMHELLRIVQQSHAPASIVLLMYTPEHLPEGWTRGERLRSASESLHPRIIDDTNGRWARGLGARTSGEVLLYSPAGRLLFQGGITSERGHEGASAGGELLERAMQSQERTARTPPTFGCALFAGKSGA